MGSSGSTPRFYEPGYYTNIYLTKYRPWFDFDIFNKYLRYEINGQLVITGSTDRETGEGYVLGSYEKLGILYIQPNWYIKKLTASETKNFNQPVYLDNNNPSYDSSTYDSRSYESNQNNSLENSYSSDENSYSSDENTYSGGASDLTGNVSEGDSKYNTHGDEYYFWGNQDFTSFIGKNIKVPAGSNYFIKAERLYDPVAKHDYLLLTLDNNNIIRINLNLDRSWYETTISNNNPSILGSRTIILGFLAQHGPFNLVDQLINDKNLYPWM